jgi:hypothetical protein
VHLSEPGLIVVDIAAADDETAFAFHTELATRWATTSLERTTHEPGQPGVRCAATSTCASPSTRRATPISPCRRTPGFPALRRLYMTATPRLWQLDEAAPRTSAPCHERSTRPSV